MSYRASCQPVRLHAEWDVPNILDEDRPRLRTWAGTPPSRGVATVWFPNGGYVWGVHWQATAKHPNHVILANLAVYSPETKLVHCLVPDFLQDLTGKPNVNVHHAIIPIGARPLLRLRKGDMAFFGIEGWGDPIVTQSVLEAHALLYVDEGTVTIP